MGTLKKAAVGIIDGIEIEMGSGNVFADLDLPDADKLKIKSGLVIEITKAMRKQGLTQKAASERMGIPQSKGQPCCMVTSPTCLSAS